MNSKKEGNWLVSYALLIFAAIFSLSLFLLLSLAHGSYNPLNWSFSSSFIFWSLIFTLPNFLILNYFIEKFNVDIVSVLGSFFDILEYQNSNKKPLDCILSHYTNVATVGLLLMTTIYVFRPFITEVIGFLSGFGMAVLCFIIFFIYSLFLVRLALGLVKINKFVYFVSCISVLFLDMQVIELFVKSVPQVS